MNEFTDKKEFDLHLFFVSIVSHLWHKLKSLWLLQYWTQPQPQDIYKEELSIDVNEADLEFFGEFVAETS